MSAPQNDPAAQAIGRMLRPNNGLAQNDLRSGRDRVNASNPEVLEAQNQSLAARVRALETMINGASLSIVCNGDGTITGTLTWGT